MSPDRTSIGKQLRNVKAQRAAEPAPKAIPGRHRRRRPPFVGGRTAHVPLAIRLLTAALLATFSCAPALAGTPWPTTAFKVDFAPAQARSDTAQPTPPVLPDRDRSTMPPAGEDDDQLDVFGERQAAWDALAMFFERSLEDAARAYQAAGYEPPSLPLFRDDAGNTFYRVQVVDESRESALAGNYGVYHSAIRFCDEPGIAAGNWFGIDAGDFVPLTSSGEAFLYAVLAHELAHAIQASYPATDDALSTCSSNTQDYKTVVEGTAEALSYLLARQHWPKFYLESHREETSTDSAGRTLEIIRYNGPTGYLDDTMVGLREYIRPFLDLSNTSDIDREMAAYTTSSFWFNLMDRYGFDFVDHLLRQPLAHGDWPSLAEWLDGAMRSFRTPLDGLYIVFPHFAAEFPSHAGSRFPLEELPEYGPGRELVPGGGSQRPGTDEEWRRAWVERILGKCQRVELTPEEPGPGEVRFALRRLSGGCLDIRWDGFNRDFEMTIEAEHGDLRLIDQVNLGLIYDRVDGELRHCYDVIKPHYSEHLWSCTHDKPFVTSGAQPLVYTKRWSEPDVRFSGEGRRFFAVTNVARNARRTRPFPEDDPLIVRVGIADTRSGDGRAYGPPFSPYKGSSTLAAGFDDKAQYGITESPTPPMMLLTFGWPVGDSDQQYHVSWQGEPPALGYRGPFTGIVTPPQDGAAESMIGSMLCQHQKDGIVGEVRRFDRDHLWIDIDTDLCEVTIPPPPGGHFPVVDHVTASLRIPFGWRYAPASAPADIVTPGMQIFIDRYTKRLPMVLSGTWDTAGRDSTQDAPGHDGPGPGGDGPGPGNGSGSGSNAAGVRSGACTCSCDELAEFDAAGEAVKSTDDDQQKMAIAREMMGCFSQCQQQYMLCRLGMPDG